MRVYVKKKDKEPLIVGIIVTIVFLCFSIGMFIAAITSGKSFIDVITSYAQNLLASIIFFECGMFYIYILIKRPIGYKAKLINKKIETYKGKQITYMEFSIEDEADLKDFSANTNYKCYTIGENDLIVGNDYALRIKEANRESKYVEEINNFKVERKLPDLDAVLFFIGKFWAGGEIFLCVLGIIMFPEYALLYIMVGILFGILLFKLLNCGVGLIFTIVCNGAIALLFIIGLVKMFSVKLPDGIDKNYFTNYMEEKGCPVTNLQDEKEYPGMTDYLITAKGTCPYLISYTTFNDKDVLWEFFTKGQKDVMQNNTNVTGKTSVSINLFSKYYEYNTSGDYYKAIVYNGNSILYASADKQYRTEVKDIFKDLHYQYEINFKEMQIAWYSLYILLFICIVSMWGTFKKTRNKGWISLIPFYNIGCLSKDVLGSAWWPLLLFVPIGNVVFMFMLYYHIAKVFNKSDSYCVLMMFIPSILWPLLVFDNSEYCSSKVMKK